MSHTLLIQLDKNLPDEIKDYYKGLTEEFNEIGRASCRERV